MAEIAASPYRHRFSQAGIEIEQHNAYPGLDVAVDAEVVSLVQGLVRSESTTKVVFGTEAGCFERLGVPTVVCGPGSMDGQGHKPDEFVEISQLQACDAMLDRLLDTLIA